MKNVRDVIPGFDLSAINKDGIQTIPLSGVKTMTVLRPVGNSGWLLGIIVPLKAATTALDDLANNLDVVNGRIRSPESCLSDVDTSD